MLLLGTVLLQLRCTCSENHKTAAWQKGKPGRGAMCKEISRIHQVKKKADSNTEVWDIDSELDSSEAMLMDGNECKQVSVCLSMSVSCCLLR